MGVIENLRDIADLIKKAGDLDLYRKIIESEGAVIELTRENRRLEEKVSELGKTLELQKCVQHWQEISLYQPGFFPRIPPGAAGLVAELARAKQLRSRPAAAP